MQDCVVFIVAPIHDFIFPVFGFFMMAFLKPPQQDLKSFEHVILHCDMQSSLTSNIDIFNAFRTSFKEIDKKNKVPLDRKSVV